MRSSLCALNAATGDNLTMNFPDYEQLASDHSRLLILIRGIGVNYLFLINLHLIKHFFLFIFLAQ